MVGQPAVRIQPFRHGFVGITGKDLKTSVPIDRRQIIEIGALVQINRIQEGPLPCGHIVMAFVLQAVRIRQNGLFHSPKDIPLAIAENLAAQVADDEDGLIMLEYDPFPGQDRFEADVSGPEYFDGQLEPVVILILGINALADGIKFALLDIVVDPPLQEVGIGFPRVQDHIFERKDRISPAEDAQKARLFHLFEL